GHSWPKSSARAAIRPPATSILRAWPTAVKRCGALAMNSEQVPSYSVLTVIAVQFAKPANPIDTLGSPDNGGDMSLYHPSPSVVCQPVTCVSRCGLRKVTVRGGNFTPQGPPRGLP